MPAQPILNYVISPHAATEMGRRGISKEEIDSVLSAPAQRLTVRIGRAVLQSLVIVAGQQDRMLLRVFVDIDRYPAEVVTAYRTSKIQKYWSRGDESSV